MAEKSIRGNSVPLGGAQATAEPSQGQALLPDTFTLKRLTEMFQERSEYNCITLNNAALSPGQQISFQVQNVGLGESLELYITGSITLTNTDGAPAAVTLSHEFPFNLISNLLIQFNGQTVVTNLSGYEILGIMAKRHKNIILGAASSAGAQPAQNLTRVDRHIAWITAGANCVLAAGNNLTGVTTATIAAGAAGVINFGMYVEVPFTVRKDLLLGMLPMQNNSVYLSCFITSPAVLGATAASPLFVAGGVPATLSNTANAITITPTYNFWAIPQPNDAKLYSFLTSFSYMLLSQGQNTFNAVGAEALQYSMPNNYYLMSLLLTLRDTNGALVDTWAGTDFPYLSYNGTARVDRRNIESRFARQIMHTEQIGLLGQLIWDGTDIEYLPNGTNTSKWLNMYRANNPQFVADIGAAVAIPVTYSALREQLVPANVQVV